MLHVRDKRSLTRYNFAAPNGITFGPHDVVLEPLQRHRCRPHESVRSNAVLARIVRRIHGPAKVSGTIPYIPENCLIGAARFGIDCQPSLSEPFLLGNGVELSAEISSISRAPSARYFSTEPKWSTPRQDQENWHKERAKALVESALPERQPGDDPACVNCRR